VQNSKVSSQLINISSSGEEINFEENLYTINKSCLAKQQPGYKARLRNPTKKIVPSSPLAGASSGSLTREAPLSPATQKAKALLTKVISINSELGSTTLDSLAKVVADPTNEAIILSKPGRKIRTGPAGRYRSNNMFSPKSGAVPTEWAISLKEPHSEGRKTLTNMNTFIGSVNE
jgi:hypothetical protein